MMLSILVACLIVLIAILIRRRLHYFSSRGQPYSKPTLSSIWKSYSPSQFSNYPKELYDGERDSDNEIIGFYSSFFQPILLVLDPSMVQDICIKDFSSFQDHGLEVDFTNNPMFYHLFNLNGDQWRALRNKLLPTFTTGKLKGMIPAIQDCAQSIVKEMNQDISLRQDVLLKDLFKKYTVAVIASVAFGIEPESIKNPDCDYRRILKLILQPSVFTLIKASLSLSLPKIFKYLKVKIFPQEIDDFYLNLTRETMEMRKKLGVKRNDFIQLLMELKEKGSVQVDHKDMEEDEKESIKQQQKLLESESTSKLEITHELLAAQVFVFILAGFENSAAIVATTNYLLGKHRDVQQRVREEVRAAKSKHGGINYESLKDMKLLGACVDEASRLYPPGYVLLRICTKTCTLRNGLTVEKGQLVYIPAKSLQNDSRYWRNPDEFIPERFLTDDILPGTYMPFGDGPRLCIAQRLALLMAKIMLAELVDNYQLLSSKMNQEPIEQTISLGRTDFKGGLRGCFQPVDQ